MSIVLEHLSFSYFEDSVLHDIDITLGDGLVHLVLGRTGSGKSTLAMLLAGLLRPRSGRVLIDGADPASRGFDRRRVQLAFQFPETQIFEMTVQNEIEYGLRNFGFSADEIVRRRDWALGCIGLATDMLPRDPSALSFGERRKVALASILALEPKYLILDEPFAGLDWHGRQSLTAIVRKLKAEGLTAVILTHETDIVSEIGDRVLIAADRTVSEPQPVTEFLYPESDPSHDLLPGYVRVLRRIQSCGLPVRGKPRDVKHAARAIASALLQGGRLN